MSSQLVLSLDIINHTSYRPDLHDLQPYLRDLLRPLSRAGRVNLELVIVGERKIRSLNKTYRNRDMSTDVLSFPAPVDTGLLGSIAISFSATQKQAAQANISWSEELNILAGHGLLHLLGYNHY